jgi:hypothetical protein
MKLPPFLEGVKLTDADRKRLESKMGNWLTAHAYISTFQPTPSSLKELELMMLFEIEEYRRLHMLQRLRARYNNLRIKFEDKKLFALAR